MFGIHWAAIDRFVYLPLFILVAFFIVRRLFFIKRAYRQLVHGDNQKILFNKFSFLKQTCKAVLLCSALMFIFIALLRPQWGKKEQVITQEGRDLAIALDISRSMLARDMQPCRLDFAKLKIKHLLEKLTCERVALIIFSGNAFIQCPLTGDKDAFLMFLDHIDAQTLASGTTALDKALEKTLELFKTTPDRKNKLAVFLTDGEDFSLNLTAAQQAAVQGNLKFFALGIGSAQGAPIPKINPDGTINGHEVDRDGKIALSCLNEALLEQLCKQLNGHYIKASYDDADIDRLMSYVSSYEKEKFEDKKISLFEEQYPWFCGLAWLCLALEWIL